MVYLGLHVDNWYQGGNMMMFCSGYAVVLNDLHGHYLFFSLELHNEFACPFDDYF
jgi:hypothetical protein